MLISTHSITIFNSSSKPSNNNFHACQEWFHHLLDMPYTSHHLADVGTCLQGSVGRLLDHAMHRTAPKHKLCSGLKHLRTGSVLQGKMCKFCVLAVQICLLGSSCTKHGPYRSADTCHACSHSRKMTPLAPETYPQDTRGSALQSPACKQAGRSDQCCIVYIEWTPLHWHTHLRRMPSTHLCQIQP